MSGLLPITLEDQIIEVRREIGYRHSVYARMVGAGKMKQQMADHRIAVMKAVQATLEKLKQEGTKHEHPAHPDPGRPDPPPD